MTRLEARWKMPCREEGLAGAGRLGYAQSALLELSERSPPLATTAAKIPRPLAADTFVVVNPCGGEEIRISTHHHEQQDL